MTDIQAHCPGCGQPLPGVLGVALVDGVILVQGDRRVVLGPVQAAMIRELSNHPSGMSARDLAAAVYSDERRENPESAIRQVKFKMNRHTLPSFGLRIVNLSGQPRSITAIYALTTIEEDSDHGQ